MSCNNCNSSYYSPYGWCNTSDECGSTCSNQYNQCNQTQCQCRPAACYAQPCYRPPVPAIVSYATLAATTTAIPTSTPGSAPVPIPVGSTTYPPTTVTPITGFSGIPITNVGGIVVNSVTGQFTVPIAGRYIVSASIGITANNTGTREVYIYKIDALTNVISLLAYDSRNATVVGPTNISITAVADLCAGDRIFFAATQNSGSPLTTTSDSRYTITRIS